MNQWESVNELQWFCERLYVKHVVDKRKLKFLNCVIRARNTKIADMLRVVYALRRIY